MCSIVLAKCNRTTPFGSRASVPRGWKQKSCMYSIRTPENETTVTVSSSGFGELWNSYVASSRHSPFTRQQVSDVGGGEKLWLRVVRAFAHLATVAAWTDRRCRLRLMSWPSQATWHLAVAYTATGSWRSLRGLLSNRWASKSSQSMVCGSRQSGSGSKYTSVGSAKLKPRRWISCRSSPVA